MLRKSFTLIELLIVIAIIAILAIVVVLALNPVQLLQQSRDSDRISDMADIQSAITIFQTDQPGASLGNAALVYVSIPDPSATSTAGDQCQGLGLPVLPAGFTYQCAASSSYRSVNGSGWIPLNLSQISEGSPFSLWPIDPTNTSSTGFYYTYSASGTQFEVTSLFESQKYKTQFGQNPIVPYYPELDAKGSNLTISPLWNPSSLVGWWSLDEGSGTIASDQSGNGNQGSWSGTIPYYTTGAKVGSYAGQFDGTTDAIAIGTANFPLGNTPRSIFMWVNPSSVINDGSYHDALGYGTFTGNQASFIRIRNLGSGAVMGINPGGGSSLSSLVIQPNVWSLIGYTYDGSGNWTVYVNTSSQVLAAGGANTILPATDTADIGKEANGNAAYFPGAIDDVRIYKRILSASEVQALYNAEK